MKKSVFRKLYAVKEEKTVVEEPVEEVSEKAENEKSGILEIETVKVSRRKNGDK